MLHDMHHHLHICPVLSDTLNSHKLGLIEFVDHDLLNRPVQFLIQSIDLRCLTENLFKLIPNLR